MTPPAPTIRPERPGDHSAIAEIVRAAFPTDAEARLIGLLRDQGDLTVSLVAEDAAGALLGHVAFSPVTTAAGHRGIGLAPVAVAEHARRRGVAAALIRGGLDRAAALGFGWSVVLGDPAYYQRFGYHPAPALGLTDPYGGGDAFQALEPTPGALPAGAGLVSYARAFDALGE